MSSEGVSLPVEITSSNTSSVPVSTVLISIPVTLQGIFSWKTSLLGFSSSGVSLQLDQISQLQLLLTSLQAMLAQSYVPVVSTPMHILHQDLFPDWNSLHYFYYQKKKKKVSFTDGKRYYQQILMVHDEMLIIMDQDSIFQKI